MPTPGAPATRYHPLPLADLSLRAERERLSPPALRSFFNIMARWSVRDEDAPRRRRNRPL
jgi:hypothetical protein